MTVLPRLLRRPHVVGRDGAGHLVAVTVLPCGAREPRHERHCYQTFTPAGLVYRNITVPIAAEPAPEPPQSAVEGHGDTAPEGAEGAPDAPDGPDGPTDTADADSEAL